MSQLLTTITMIFYASRTRRLVTIVRIFHRYNTFSIYSLHINIKYYLFKYVTSIIYIVNVLQFVGFSFYLATSINILIRNVDFRKHSLECKTLLKKINEFRIDYLGHNRPCGSDPLIGSIHVITTATLSRLCLYKCQRASSKKHIG